MKLHLFSRVLLLALLAAGTYQAEAARGNAGISVDSHTYTENKAFDATNASKDALKPYTKDGAGTASISANADLALALYVREGQVVMGNGKDTNHVTVTLTPTLPSTIEYYATGAGTSFCVAGNEAAVELNNATLKSKVATSMVVGSPSGNGTLVVSNGSVIDNQSNSGINFLIGATSNETNHYGAHIHATKTGSSWRDKKYSGEYETLSTGKEIGGGYVTVKDNSKIFGGYNGLSIGEGSLNVEGGSAVYSGFEGSASPTAAPTASTGQADNFESSIGAVAGASAAVSVKDNSTFSTGVGLKIGAFDNTDVTINVDNNSRFEVANRNGGAGKAFIGTEFEVTGNDTLGYDRTWTETGAANTTVNINVSNTSTLKFNELQIGSSKEKDGEINITLDGTSRMESAAMTMYDGTITNAGELSVNGKIALNGGKLSLEGGTLSANGLTVAGGATLSAQAPSTAVATLSLDDVATVHNTTTIGTATTDITMAAGSTLELNGGSIDLNGKALTFEGVITLDLTVNGTVAWEESVLLFSDVASFNGSTEDYTALASDYFTGINLSGYVVNLVYNAEDKTLSLHNIPEPTTATLSLLALAGLAARRRRK